MLIPSYLKGQEKETLPNGIAYYNPTPTSQVAQVQPMLNVQFDLGGVNTIILQNQDRINRAMYKDFS
nr:hypothetical protein [Acinetobacter sp. ACNIH2]